MNCGNLLRGFFLSCGAILFSIQMAQSPVRAQEAVSPETEEQATPLQEPLEPVTSEKTKSRIHVSAILGDNKEHITSGLVWRVYENVGENVSPALVEKSAEPSPAFELPDGQYIIQAAYGYASTSKRIHVQGAPLTEVLNINAGALKLSGTVGDNPIPSSQISFSVYVSIGTDMEGRLIVSDGKPGNIIRLPEGTYHIVSTYGDANAIQRTDLKVETGQVTEAVLNHRAAVVTLKLVANVGSEAYADTAFSVLTPGGDVVREAIGAFPRVTLAEGDYMLIARHDNKVYSREFKVEAGLNRDIEVVESKDMTGETTPDQD
jgi:hypothetical protein